MIMRIGELSRRSGISVRMLRYFEQEKLLSPGRTGAGYRDYAEEDEETVRRIRLLQEAGITLPAIRQILPCLRSGAPEFVPCAALRDGLRQQIGRLEGRISALAHSVSLLEGFLRTLPAETVAPPMPMTRGRRRKGA